MKKINPYSLKALKNSLIKQDDNFKQDWEKFSKLVNEEEFWKKYNNEFDRKRKNVKLLAKKISSIELNDINETLDFANEIEKELNKEKNNIYTYIDFSSHELNSVIEKLNDNDDNSFLAYEHEINLDEINQNNNEETTVIEIKGNIKIN
ncbi:hypothetical protein [Mycoplasmopsis meleagridis]|uniref:hypothetical protein n=1 Tax=Mycoplasmopsis meleagridis TaxID=29561 RepID=UPI00073D1C9D|nr:hypothetical protein [Mycoplasmopsis meleagridis]KUH47650.1 hypothetical protein ASB56_00760 [Mycoplasmopsis meleagridis]